MITHSLYSLYSCRRLNEHLAATSTQEDRDTASSCNNSTLRRAPTASSGSSAPPPSLTYPVSSVLSPHALAMYCNTRLLILSSGNETSAPFNGSQHFAASIATGYRTRRVRRVNSDGSHSLLVVHTHSLLTVCLCRTVLL